MIANEMIAFCGLSCHKCGAFLATVSNDDKKKAEVATHWSQLYKVAIKPEEINCQGCLSDGSIFMYCRVCEIRKCGREKGIENCACCLDYICAKLEKILSMAPDAREKLKEIRSSF